MIHKKNCLLFSLFWGLALFLNAETSYDRGVEAYRLSQLDQAVSALNLALTEEPGQDKVHLLLGVVYHKLGQYDRAEEVYLKGMALFGPNRDDLVFNLANVYRIINRNEEALNLYSEVASGQSMSNADSTINRANYYSNLGEYALAISDYRAYLAMEPTTSQRDEIERMIAFLTQSLNDEAEQQRLAAERAANAEQQAALDEQRRLEAAQRAADEAARQQALLDEILASLDDVSQETQVMGAGSENIVLDDEESDIEE